MSQVFRIALPDKDVHRGKVVEMVLDSRYASPKIDTLASPPHAGLIFLNWTDTTGILGGITKILCSFPHGYNNYVPTVVGLYQSITGGGNTLPLQIGAIGMLTIDADQTNINLKYFSIDPFNPATAITPFILIIKFYVMAEHGTGT